MTRSTKTLLGSAAALAVAGYVYVTIAPGGGALVRDSARGLRRLLGISTAQDMADYAAADAARAAYAARTR